MPWRKPAATACIAQRSTCLPDTCPALWPHVVTLPLSERVRVRVATHTARRDACTRCMQSGKFVPEKSNIWRDTVDGYYDWVKVGGAPAGGYSYRKLSPPHTHARTHVCRQEACVERVCCTPCLA